MGVELVPFLMAKEILREKQPVFRRCDVGSAKRRTGHCRCWAGPGKRSGGRRQSGGSRQHSIEDGALGAIWPEAEPLGLEEHLHLYPGLRQEARREGAFRKLSYHSRAKGTPYVVSAGIYDNQATIAEISKLSSMK